MISWRCPSYDLFVSLTVFCPTIFTTANILTSGPLYTNGYPYGIETTPVCVGIIS